ncbi:SDR family oxidoreductase [Streptomyces anulatus]|uniref:SDR family oxidoreductase n=1 Tax=Streptomyces anulatus TaxID=1892 RepID=UPI00342E9D3A
MLGAIRQKRSAGRAVSTRSLTRRPRRGRAGGAEPRTNLVAYSAAKAGLLGLTRSLARELGPYGICVNTVMLGAIQVEAENDLPAQHLSRPEGQIKRQCVPRRGRPEVVAALWRFSWAPPPRSSRGSPSTSTAAGRCTETTNKQGDKPK